MRIDDIEKLLSDNAIKFEQQFCDDIGIIKNNLSKQFDMVLLYINVIASDPYAEADDYTSISITAIYKNLISIYSALDLTRQGMYGSARIIFRNIFEYLILAKTVAIKEEYSLLKKWEHGENISLRIDVFRDLVSPNSDEIKEYWKLMCEFTHSTVYSQQIILKFEDIINELMFNMVCIKMLLDMNYHVLNTYIANRSIQYYTEFMMDIEEKGSFKKAKQDIREQINIMRKSLKNLPKKVVNDFCKKWIFRN
ncbi:MAG: hypothetical protein QM697_14945 [Lachnospiraceae bacterium]